MRTIDSHVHLIDVTTHDWYPALKQMAEGLSLPQLYRDFLLPDYRSAAGEELSVDAFVHVSATTKPRAYLDETRWVGQVADDHELELAIIGTVDPSLSSREIEADLAAQAAKTVLGWLDERGHVFDLVTQPDQLAAWLRRLESFPELSVVLEHTGWPAGTGEVDRQRWRTALRDFGTATEAPCKLSGLGMTTADLSEPVLRPWLDHAIDTLGWQRLMFGSNMPIETMAGSYSDWITTLKAVVGQAAIEDQELFWGGNAARVYRS